MGANKTHVIIKYSSYALIIYPNPRSKTLSIDRVRMLEGAPEVDLDTVGSTKVGGMVVEVIDPVEDYLKVR
jgi:hypothetical protein